MIGTRLSDRYEIVGELGRGGMGVVYRARDPVLSRDVAVKMVSLEESPEISEERFRREARVVAGLDHPAIVPIFDFGRHRHWLYFVMPVVRGTTLHNLIASDGLNLGDTLEIVAQIAEALDYSAGRGVVHRDVKPENVMVAGRGPAIRARIMDFGLALRDAGSRITKTGQLPGTLAYLSPEYVLSAQVDGRGDLYSLGTILYECLAGKPPFTGPQGSVLFRIVHEEPPPLSVDERLAEIVSRCLAKEPEDRPARGGELANELRRYLDALSDTARSQTPMSEELRRIQARRASAPALIGRAAELAELTRRLDAAVAGECQLVLLGGEAGIGKSRLMLELELRARARGLRVARGRFSRQQGTFPHHGLCELIQDFYRAKTEASSTGLPEMGDLAPELLRRFPVLGEIAELRQAAGGRRPAFDEGAAQGDQALVFELLARALVRLAAGKPAILLLENLHLAGTSLAALEYLARRLAPTPTLIAGSYRTTEVPRRGGVKELERGIADDPRCAVIKLEALSADEHRDLTLSLLQSASGVGLRLDGDLAARLFEATEGNPFFTRELLRALLDAGDVARDETGCWVPADEAAIGSALPETIQQAVEARLEGLPEELLATLRTASVLGRSFEIDDLERLSGGHDDLDEAIDRLIREGILEEDRRSRGDVVIFSSGVVREVLHGSVTRRRRRSLHRRYAAQLEERYAGRLERVYPQLVYHFSEGDVAVKTVAYALMLARMSAGAVSPTDTIRATRTALEFVEDEDLDDSGEVEGELRLLLASALRTVGNIAGSLREAARAVRAYRQRGHQGPAAAACLVAAETAWQIRRVDETRRWLAKGIEFARAAGARRKLRGLLTLAATVANLRGERGRAREYLEEAAADPVAGPGRAARAPASRPPPASVRPAVVSELRVPVPAAFDDLDPALALFVEPAEVIPNVFETLTRVGEGARIEPCLASSYQLEDGGRRLSLNLRDDVRFHDGRPLTAADVRYSFERLLASPYPGVESALMPIRGARDVFARRRAELPGLIVESSSRLVFELEEPVAFFPAMLANPMTVIVPEGGDFATNWRQGCAGTGPFRVVAVVPRERVELEANPDYWRPGLPKSRRLIFELGVGARRAAAAFRAGELSIASCLRPRDFDGLRREPEFMHGFCESPGFSTYFLVPNSRRGPLADRELRRAFAGGLDVEAIVRTTLGPLGQPAHGLISPGLPGHARRPRPADFASAGSLGHLSLATSVHPAFQGQYAHVWRRLREAITGLGIDLEAIDLPLPEALEKIKRGEVDLAAARRMAAYPDADAFVNLFHSRDGLLGQLLENRQLDRLIEKGRAETDAALRHAVYREIEQLLAREALLIPLFDEQLCCVARPEVSGLRIQLGWPKVAYDRLVVA